MQPLGRSSPRGVSIIESVIAMAVLSIGILGLSGLQTVAVRANGLGQRMQVANELANDFLENARRASYTSTLLASRASVTSTTDPAVTVFWDLGRKDVLTNKPSFSEKPGDTNALTAGALGSTYQGLSGDVDKNGSWTFVRYWNVFDVDLANAGVAQGKLVQVIVRWREPGVGQRQVTASTFRANPAAFFQ
jgi:type II secretory pathway pseudopilin PulG